jgi:signal transduction histidine kinase/CheY-like chemotaxis protein
VQTGDDFEIEYRLRHCGGDHRWTLTRALPVRDETGAIVRWMGTCTDIHDQKLTQTALELSEDALRAADRRKDEFLAMLAHELRNPLAPIRTAAALIQRTPDVPPAVQSAGAVIGWQTEHLSRLVDDLLEVSRVTRGLVELDLQGFDLRDTARAAIEQARPLIEQRRHVLAVELPDAPVQVRADRTRLVQVIANLLNNAARYSPEGRSITLRVRGDGTHATVDVIDTGAGIDTALLPHVFDLFTQGRRTLDRRQGGLGIGLALVRRIVALHGGQVEAHSGGPGSGSRFTITLPCDATGAGATPEADIAAPARPLVLALVDDNADALDTMALLLATYGHRVQAYSSAEALLADHDRGPCDAHLLDIGLPGPSGYELARELRGRPGGERAVLIALTGYGQPTDIAKAKAARFDAHLVKPVDPERLLALLARLSPA